MLFVFLCPGTPEGSTGSGSVNHCVYNLLPLCASVYICPVVTCWERADLLALVCGV